MSKRSGQQRNMDVIRAYQRLVKPGAFTVAEVVDWGLSVGLFPIPTIRDLQSLQDEWDARLEQVVKELEQASASVPGGSSPV